MRAQPRRGVVRCVAAIIATIAIAAPIAQSRNARIETATRESRQLFESWLGPVTSSPQLELSAVPSQSPPMTMAVEREIAFAIARSYWPQPATTLMLGAARFLENRAIAQIFDRSFGRAGAGVEAVLLFGGHYVRAFPELRFDGANAGLRRDRSPVARAALAFATLERMIGEPRMIGAMKVVVEARPVSDAEVIHAFDLALGQDIDWLFDAALDPAAAMDYRLGTVTVDGCSPAPCQRVQVEVLHDGRAAFTDVEVRVDFADGQSASAPWNGEGPSRRFTFEAPQPPVRVRVDPDSLNLMDDNLLDQSRTFGVATNAPIAKWTLRWAVWLQDVLLTYASVV